MFYEILSNRLINIKVNIIRKISNFFCFIILLINKIEFTDYRSSYLLLHYDTISRYLFQYRYTSKLGFGKESMLLFSFLRNMELHLQCANISSSTQFSKIPKVVAGSLAEGIKETAISSSWLNLKTVSKQDSRRKCSAWKDFIFKPLNFLG